MDLAIALAGDSTVSLLMGKADGTFAPALRFSSGGSGPYSLELVDEWGRVLPTFEHRGRTWYFCSQRCLTRFSASPGEFTSRELQMVRLDGAIIDAETVGSPITYQGNPAVQVVVRVQEVTELERTVRALQADERFARTERAGGPAAQTP